MTKSPTPPTSALPPSLTAALASLDLTPETELNYYRQQRAQTGEAPPADEPDHPQRPDIASEPPVESSPANHITPTPEVESSPTPPVPIPEIIGATTAPLEAPAADLETTTASETDPAPIEGLPSPTPVDPDVSQTDADIAQLDPEPDIDPQTIDTDQSEDHPLDPAVPSSAPATLEIQAPTAPDTIIEQHEASFLPEEMAEPDTAPEPGTAPEPDTATEQSMAIVAQPNPELVATDDMATDDMATDDMAMIEIDTIPDPDIEVPDGLAAPALPPSDFPQSYENYLDPSIEDYLESSEALLRHLEESTSPTPAKRAPQTPAKPAVVNTTSGAGKQLRRFWILLGLLLLFSILGVGGLLFWRLNLGSKLFRWGTPSTPQPTAPSSPTETSPPVLETPRSPAAATGSPTPTTTPNTPSPAVTPSSPPVAPSPTPLNPAAPTNTPSPAASPSPAATPSTAVDPPTKFYIVTEFQGADALTNVRKIVPTAAEVEFAGQRMIQLGIRSSQSEAEALIKELEAKGLTASMRTQKN